MTDRERKIRETILIGMNEIVTSLNDENAIESWLKCGVPDGASEEEIREMASDDKAFEECASLFLRIMGQKSAYKDGLRVGKMLITANKSKTLNLPQWNITETTGYVPITTFWDDFSIAEGFGGNAIQDAFDRAFEEWKGNYKYLTELVMVLNHKIWQHYKNNKSYAKLYQDLWSKADIYACVNLKGKEANYFFATTD